MTRLPADISRVLAPRPSRANTTADDDDEPSITELCVSLIHPGMCMLKYPRSFGAPMLSYNPGQNGYFLMGKLLFSASYARKFTNAFYEHIFKDY